MIAVFPKSISNKAIITYLVSLIVVSIVFMNYAMPFKFMLMGMVFVLLFFALAPALSRSWKIIPPKVFARNLFLTALVIRVIWVVFSYYFYTKNTGQPFEWGAADSIGYHGEAESLYAHNWSIAWQYWGLKQGVSDMGYPLYLTAVYKIFGPDIIIARLFKALFSAITCILIYKLSSRIFGEFTGRIAGLFCMLMPNLIVYCGLHTKETEMVFCAMMFLERTDFLLRTKHYSIINIVIPILLALVLFFFRTVLGVVAIFSFFSALLFNPERVIKKGKKILLAVWMFVAVVVLAGGTIAMEVENYWNMRVTNEVTKREDQSNKGAKWAKYATGTVMAPMIFVLPFSTMVDTEQYNQNVMHSGNYVKNFLGIFVLFAFFYAFKQKKWRDFSLIGVFTIGYLGVISFSGYANAERFHMPALPCVLMMAAYGVSQLNAKNIKYVNIWCFVVVLMEFSWAFFKLGSRGIASF